MVVEAVLVVVISDAVVVSDVVVVVKVVDRVLEDAVDSAVVVVMEEVVSDVNLNVVLLVEVESVVLDDTM